MSPLISTETKAKDTDSAFYLAHIAVNRSLKALFQSRIPTSSSSLHNRFWL